MLAQTFYDSSASYATGQWATLRQRYETDGYLYIRTCIPPAAVQQVLHFHCRPSAMPPHGADTAAYAVQARSLLLAELSCHCPEKVSPDGHLQNGAGRLGLLSRYG